VTHLFVRKALKKVGLLESMTSFKRKFIPANNSFMPCTPHLLIAVNRGLHWCVENRLIEGTDYLEFGVFRGFTLWYVQALARDMGVHDLRFFGFDSFFGLPPINGIDSGGEFQEAAYTCPRNDVERFLTSYGVDWTRTHLVEGWFQKTLTQKTRESLNLRRCSLCVIDCDLYESTDLALKFLEPIIADQCMVLFDDWRSFENDPNRGEQKAFAEFLQRNPQIQAQPFVEFGGHGKGFIARRRPSKLQYK
jgi:O-methyltransferase